MKIQLITLLLGMWSASVFAAASSPIVGDWQGNLDLGGASLRLAFHITRTDAGFEVTMDSPDQGALGIPGKVSHIDSTRVKLEFTDLGAIYEGQYADEKLSGEYRQGGMSIPLAMDRLLQEISLHRPQEPKPPFPYHIEEVSFRNDAARIRLAGTLTYPKRQAIKAKVIMVTGSGAQDRNEELFGHKPFWVIADHLTRRGYAVLRYDDRGVGESEGDFESSSLTDLVSDADAGLDFLARREGMEDIPTGLIGHSEGGYVAGILASKGAKLDFIVMLAGPAVRGDILMREQVEAMLAGVDYPGEKLPAKLASLDKIIGLLQASDLDRNIKSDLLPLVKEYVAHDGPVNEASVDMAVRFYDDSKIRQLIRFDPYTEFKGIALPVLALFGEKDLQVLPQSNMKGIKAAIDGEQWVTAKVFDDLNHLFQTSTTGKPVEYGKISETFAPQVLDYMVNWMNDIAGR